MKFITVSPGITRYDIEGGNVRGYLVRIRRNGTTSSKFFSDMKLGGKRKALVEAKAHYDALEKSAGPVKSSSLNKLTSRNTTGTVGVYCTRVTDARSPKTDSWIYFAAWTDESGKRVKVGFPCNRFGDEMALALACLARKLELNDRDEVVKKYESRVKRSTARNKNKAATTKTSAKKPSVKKKSRV